METPSNYDNFQMSDNINELAKALSDFQAQVPTISKDADNPFFKSKYASLENILTSIRKPMKECGLSFTQVPVGASSLVTTLMHTSGQYIQAKADMSPKDNSPQAQGSAITYMRRYALSAILGIATDEDDDGNQATHQKASAPAAKPAPKPKPTAVDGAMANIKKATTPQQLLDLRDRIEASEILKETEKKLLVQVIDNKMPTEEVEPVEEEITANE